MTAAEAVETSVTNILSQNHTNLDDLPSPKCTDSAGFKAFTFWQFSSIMYSWERNKKQTNEFEV